MRRAAQLALAVALAAVPAGGARGSEVGQSRTVGLGFVVGTPTSLAAKYFLHPRGAVDLQVSFWDFQGQAGCGADNTCPALSYLSVASDYLWQQPFSANDRLLHWHLGVGMRLSYYDRQLMEPYWISARIPFGVDLTFESLDFLELFAELVPRVLVVPGLRGGLEAFAGARFYY